MTQFVHLFGGAATTAERSKELLGGKGANLAEMASIGLPVPPGFTLTTEVCTLYHAAARRGGPSPSAGASGLDLPLAKTLVVSPGAL